MLTALVMSFRENLEILLIVISLFAYLQQANRSNLRAALIWGCLAGVLASLACGSFLYQQYVALSGVAKQVLEGSILVLAAGLIFYNILCISEAGESVENTRNIKLGSMSLFFLTFLTSFREYFEIFMFVLPYLGTQPFQVLAGIVLGLIVAIITIWAAYNTTLKLNLKHVFSLITLLLVLVGTELFGEGLMTLFPAGDHYLQFSAYAIYGLPLLWLTIKRMLKQ